MTLSMFDACVPPMLRTLRALDTILAKAEAHAAAKKIDPAVLLASRLYPDMFAFTRQVQIATDHAKGAAARLAGLEVPKFDDNEQSFADLHARIAKTIAFVESVGAEQINGSEERDITLKAGPRELSFKGAAYLTGFAIPNLYFHTVTAYAILRHNGVELGKSDFLGA